MRVETVHGGIGRFQVINAREEEPTMVAQLPQQVLLLLVLGEWTCSLSTFYYIFRRRSSWPNRLPSRVPLKYSFDHPIVMSDRYARSFSSVSTRSSLETVNIALLPVTQLFVSLKDFLPIPERSL